MKFQIKTNSLNFQLKNAVIKEYPKLENLEITPSKKEQSFKSKDYYGYDEVKVAGVTNSIDENIKPENIKKDVSILGVTGNVEEINTTEISINPSDTEKVVTPEAPYNGFSKVTVGAQSGINPDEYFETIVTRSTKSGFMSRYYVKKGPDLVLEPDVTDLSYFASNYEYSFLPNMDTSNVIDFSNFMAGSNKVTIMPPYNTSKATIVSGFLSGSGLISCPLFDFGKVISLGGNSIFGYGNPTKLTDLGGFKDLGKAYLTTQSANYSYYKLVLSKATNLTHESLMNVINNLYDIATAGVQPQQLVLGSTNLAKLTDEEKAIATNKGWSLS